MDHNEPSETIQVTPGAVHQSTTPRRSMRSRGYVTSYGEGRVCQTTECQTKLSRYNDESHCFMHRSSPPPDQPALRHLTGP